jgi:hypothetical protein
MPRKHASLLLAHAAADHPYARKLAAFVEAGCDVRCDPGEGLLRSDQHLVDLAEQSSGPLVLLLSKDSWPQRLPRERWDPLLLESPLACVLLNACPFPELLRRRSFFHAQSDNAERGLKRWLWRQLREPGEAARFEWSADLEHLYATLADRPGVRGASAESARRFAREAAGEFERVLWIPCYGRSLAECASELGAQLGLVMDGQEAENRRRVLETMAARRCLVVLDGPAEPVRAALVVENRCSILMTTEPSEIRETPRTFDYALELVRSRRLAEAYNLLQMLMEETADPGACARELAWICEHWGRTAEAERLRRFDPMPSRQMGLFEQG